MSAALFRTDVAAIGLIPSTSDDVFLIAAIRVNDPNYHLLAYNTSNNNYEYLEGGIGSMLSTAGALPTPYVLHYFKIFSPSAYTTLYPQSMYHIGLTPFLDAAATMLVAGGVVYPQVSSTGVCQLTFGQPTDAQAPTWPGIYITTNDPVIAPSTGGVYLGYKYNLGASPYQVGVVNGPVIASTPIYPAQGTLTDSTYGGVPFGISPNNPVSETTSYSTVFLPTNWWVGVGDGSAAACSAQVSPENQFANVIPSMCGRWGAKGDTTADFYTTNCSDITPLMGNIRQSDCIFSQGRMYYLPDGNVTSTPPQTIPGRCGIPWAASTQFRDMADNTIMNVGNPYGNCNSSQASDPSACQFSSTGTAACVAIEATPTQPTCPDGTSTPGNCGPDCTKVTADQCPVADICNGCTPSCDTSPCSDSTVTSPSTTMWIIIAILAVIAIGLFLMVMHDGSKKKKAKTHGMYDAPPGTVVAGKST